MPLKEADPAWGAMVTPAVIGAALGSGVFLLVMLTLLFYRHNASQKAEDDLWSTWERQSYRPSGRSDRTGASWLPINGTSLTGAADTKRPRKPPHQRRGARPPLYLPLQSRVRRLSPHHLHRNCFYQPDFKPNTAPIFPFPNLLTTTSWKRQVNHWGKQTNNSNPQYYVVSHCWE